MQYVLSAAEKRFEAAIEAVWAIYHQISVKRRVMDDMPGEVRREAMAEFDKNIESEYGDALRSARIELTIANAECRLDSGRP